LPDAFVNPFKDEIAGIDKKSDAWMKEYYALHGECRWHSLTSLAKINDTIQRLEKYVDALRREENGIEARIHEAGQALSDPSLRPGTWLNPLHWFDPRQIGLRKRGRGLRQDLKQLREKAARVAQSLAAAHGEEREARKDLERYLSFNTWENTFAIFDRLAKIRTINTLRKRRIEWAARMDALLSPRNKKLAEQDALIESLEAKRRQALAMGARPDADADRAGRRRLPAEGGCCLEGALSPGMAIARLENELARQRGVRERLRERFQADVDEFWRLARVKGVILDGDGLCRAGRGTVELNPMAALARSLSKKCLVRVVFSQEAGLKAFFGRARLDKALGQNYSEAPAGAPADDCIVKAASADPGYFVVSNERYGRFADCPAVREKRIFPFAIDGDRKTISVRDLNVTAKYR